MSKDIKDIFKQEALAQFKLSLKYMFEQDREAFEELKKYIEDLIKHE